MIADRKIVKVVCRNDLIDTLDAGPEGAVDVVLSIGGDRYCASVGGVVRDERCTGPPVPCGDVFSVSLCGLSECPVGRECRMLHYDVPECFNECACQ